MQSLPAAESLHMNRELDQSESGDQNNMAAQRRKQHQQRQKKSTKEKIDRLMSDGAKNYPAYLKLIYTGESELSSEDEFSADVATCRQKSPSTFDQSSALGNAQNASDGNSDIINQSADRISGNALDNSMSSSCNSFTSSYSSSYHSSSSANRVSKLPEEKGKKIGTPESDKLLDTGREKQGSPVDVVSGVDGTLVERQIAVGEVQRRNSASSIKATSPFCAHWSSEFPSPFLQAQQQQQQQPQQPGCEDEDADRPLMRMELEKIQDDISTLKTVLAMKQKEAADLRQKLGHRPISDLKTSLQSLKESEAFQKTNAVCKSFSAYASRKMDNFRKLNMFKPVEYYKGTSYGNMKHSVSTDEINAKQNPLPTSRSDTNVARRLTLDKPGEGSTTRPSGGYQRNQTRNHKDI